MSWVGPVIAIGAAGIAGYAVFKAAASYKSADAASSRAEAKETETEWKSEVFDTPEDLSDYNARSRKECKRYARAQADRFWDDKRFLGRLFSNKAKQKDEIYRQAFNRCMNEY